MAMVRFEDVVKRVNIKVDRFDTDRLYYCGGEHIESDEFTTHSKGLIKGSTIGYKFHFGFNPGHILFVSRNPHLRKCSMADYYGVCSDSTYVIETRDENVLMQKYLLLELQSDRFWKWAEEHKSGGVNYLINYATLNTYEFSLPSLSEQKVLADKLWAAYHLKESYKKLLQATDDMVKAKFIQMFGLPNQTNPQEGLTPLKDVLSDNFVGDWGKDDKDGSGVKVLTTKNFRNNGYLDYNEVITRQIPNQKVESKKIFNGDILLERSGGTNDNPVGRTVYFNRNDLYLCNNFVQVLRCKDEVNSLFVATQLHIIYNTQKRFIKTLGNKTTGIQNVNFQKYLNILLIIPNRKEQDSFAEIVNTAEQTKSSLRSSISSINKVIKSLINGDG